MVELLFYQALTSRPNCLTSPKSALLINCTPLQFPKLLNSRELGAEVSFIGAPELDGNCARRWSYTRLLAGELPRCRPLCRLPGDQNATARPKIGKILGRAV